MNTQAFELLRLNHGKIDNVTLLLHAEVLNAKGRISDEEHRQIKELVNPSMVEEVVI